MMKKKLIHLEDMWSNNSLADERFMKDSVICSWPTMNYYKQHTPIILKQLLELKCYLDTGRARGLKTHLVVCNSFVSVSIVMFHRASVSDTTIVRDLLPYWSTSLLRAAYALATIYQRTKYSGNKYQISWWRRTLVIAPPKYRTVLDGASLLKQDLLTQFASSE